MRLVYSPPVVWPAFFTALHPEAAARFAVDLMTVADEVREHEALRHARHLAQVWRMPLGHAGRATLFGTERGAALALVPADRKVSAPRFRSLLDVEDLRVLRGDRGVGRVGWTGMPGDPGALPAVPALFGAACWVDERVLALRRIVVALEATRSASLATADYVRLTGARVASFTGTTRLLDEGGMISEEI
jgi:prolyl-tRNA editing enzyme YbaK/EbsC (Cys-tRNA(Pro) deacylase)